MADPTQRLDDEDYDLLIEGLNQDSSEASNRVLMLGPGDKAGLKERVRIRKALERPGGDVRVARYQRLKQAESIGPGAYPTSQGMRVPMASDKGLLQRAGEGLQQGLSRAHLPSQALAHLSQTPTSVAGVDPNSGTSVGAPVDEGLGTRIGRGVAGAAGRVAGLAEFPITAPIQGASALLQGRQGAPQIQGMIEGALAPIKTTTDIAMDPHGFAGKMREDPGGTIADVGMMGLGALGAAHGLRGVEGRAFPETTSSNFRPGYGKNPIPVEGDPIGRHPNYGQSPNLDATPQAPKITVGGAPIQLEMWRRPELQENMEFEPPPAEPQPVTDQRQTSLLEGPYQQHLPMEEGQTYSPLGPQGSNIMPGEYGEGRRMGPAQDAAPPPVVDNPPGQVANPAQPTQQSPTGLQGAQARVARRRGGTASFLGTQEAYEMAVDYAKRLAAHLSQRGDHPGPAPTFIPASLHALERSGQDMFKADSLISTLTKEAARWGLPISKDEWKVSGLDALAAANRGRLVSKDQVREAMRGVSPGVEVKQLGGRPKSMPRTPEGMAARNEVFNRFQPAIERAHQEGNTAHRERLETQRDLEADWAYKLPVEETAGPSRYPSPTLQLPGGENYREVVLHAPEYKPYRVQAHGAGWEILSSTGEVVAKTDVPSEVAKLLREHNPQAATYHGGHFDTPNTLAHMRLTDRTLPDGRKMAFAEEFQSDWEKASRAAKDVPTREELDAAGRERDITQQAYQEALKRAANNANANKGQADRELSLQLQRAYDASEAAKDRHNTLLGLWREKAQVPTHPLLPHWRDLLFKQLLKTAVEEGHDRVGWTTGEQQAARYDLSKHVQALMYRDGELAVYPLEGGRRTHSVSPKELPDYVGADLAARLLEKGVVEEEGLKFGGKWATDLYDRAMVDLANKWGKRYGVQVEKTVTKTGGYDAVIQDQAASRLEGALGDAGLRNAEINEISQNWGAWGRERARQLDPEAVDAYERMTERAQGEEVHTLRLTPEARAAILSEGFPLTGFATEPARSTPTNPIAPAVFHGVQEMSIPGRPPRPSIKLYNMTADVPEHNLKTGSTVSETTLRKAGFDPPPEQRPGDPAPIPPTPTPLTSAADAARQRLRERARGSHISSEFEAIGGSLADYGIIGADAILRGAIDFHTWSAEMLRDHPDILPDLPGIYAHSQFVAAATRNATEGRTVTTSYDAVLGVGVTGPLRDIVADHFATVPDSPLVVDSTSRMAAAYASATDNVLGSSPAFSRILRRAPRLYRAIETYLTSGQVSQMGLTLTERSFNTLMSEGGQFKPNDPVTLARKTLFADFLNSEQAKSVIASNEADRARFEDISARKAAIEGAEAQGLESTAPPISPEDLKFLDEVTDEGGAYVMPPEVDIPQLTPEQEMQFGADPVMSQAIEFYREKFQKPREAIAPKAGVRSFSLSPSGLYAKVKWYENPLDIPQGERVFVPGGGPQVWDYARTKAQSAKRRTGAAPGGMILSRDPIQIMHETWNDSYRAAGKNQLFDIVAQYDQSKVLTRLPNGTYRPLRAGEKINFGDDRVPLERLDLLGQSVLLPEPVASAFRNANKAIERQESVKAWRLFTRTVVGAALMIPADITSHGLGFVSALTSGVPLGQGGPLPIKFAGKFGGALGKSLAMIYDQVSILNDPERFEKSLIETAGAQRSSHYDLATIPIKDLFTSPLLYTRKFGHDVIRQGALGAVSNRIPILGHARDYMFAMPGVDQGFRGQESIARVIFNEGLKHIDPTLSPHQRRFMLNNELGNYVRQMEGQLARGMKVIDPFARAGIALTKSGVKHFLFQHDATGRPSMNTFINNAVTISTIVAFVKFNDPQHRWIWEIGGLKLGDVPVWINGKRTDIGGSTILNGLHRGLNFFGTKDAFEEYAHGSGEIGPTLEAQARGITNFWAARIGVQWRLPLIAATGRDPGFNLGQQVAKPSDTNQLGENFAAAGARFAPMIGKYQEDIAAGGHNTTPDGEMSKWIKYASDVVGLNLSPRSDDYETVEVPAKRQGIASAKTAATTEAIVREASRMNPNQWGEYVQAQMHRLHEQDRAAAFQTIFHRLLNTEENTQKKAAYGRARQSNPGLPTLAPRR